MATGNTEHGISVIIPTCNGGPVFLKCLDAIVSQDYEHEVQIVVIDSGSTDGTPEMAGKAGAVVKRIDKARFHHAGTRNHALSYARFNKVVYTVQDAIPCSNTCLSDLAQSLSEKGVAAAYTDQIPLDDASVYARFETESTSNARGHIPILQHLESLESFQEMPYDKAYRAIGLDNVCAIYRKELLIKTNFPEVDFAEDMAWAFKILLLGHKIRYQPDIKMKHSHNRSPEYGFNRQIVNSFWCARIMKRVREDMSYLTIRDLMALTLRVRAFVNQLGSNGLTENTSHIQGGRESSQVIDKILKKYPFSKKVRRFFVEGFSKDLELHLPELRIIEQQVKQSIQHIYGLIFENNKVMVGDEPVEIIDQIVANVLGRIYGEVYAGYMLKDKASSEIKAFFRPFLKGI